MRRSVCGLFYRLTLRSKFEGATSRTQTTQADNMPPCEEQPHAAKAASLQPPSAATTLAPRGVGGDGRHVLDAADLDAGAGERAQR